MHQQTWAQCVSRAAWCWVFGHCARIGRPDEHWASSLLLHAQKNLVGLMGLKYQPWPDDSLSQFPAWTSPLNSRVTASSLLSPGSSTVLQLSTSKTDLLVLSPALLPTDVNPLLGKTKHHLKQGQLQPSRCSDLNLEATPDLALIPYHPHTPSAPFANCVQNLITSQPLLCPCPGPVSHRLLPLPECFSLLTRLLPTAACAPLKRQAGPQRFSACWGCRLPSHPEADRGLTPTPLPLLAAGQDPDGPCNSPLSRRYLESQTGVAGILGTMKNTGREGASESHTWLQAPVLPLTSWVTKAKSLMSLSLSFLLSGSTDLPCPQRRSR